MVRVTPTTIGGFPARNSSGNAHQLHFTGTDCTGTAYVPGTTAATFGGRALAWAQNLYIPKPVPGVVTEIDRTIVLRSRVVENASGQLVCENDTFRTVYTEALTVPTSVFDAFVAPFSITGLPSFPGEP
jgi:hypothetical protein